MLHAHTHTLIYTHTCTCAHTRIHIQTRTYGFMVGIGSSSSLLSVSNIDTLLITSLDEETSSVRSGVAVFFGALAGVYIIGENN